MDSNTHATGPADALTALAALVDRLAAQDLCGLSDGVRAERVLVLRRLVDRLEGHWLRELADLDARGAAGADQDQPAASTASWLRAGLRMGPSTASGCVRTARALFRGPLAATARALTNGDISVAHASVVAAGTQELANHVVTEAEPVLVDAARRLDPPRLRRVLAHLRLVADPDGADQARERRHAGRWLRLIPSFEGMVAIDGLLEPEAGQTVLAALEPLVRPTGADDPRSSGQRTADGLCELARRHLEGGRLPQTGGVRPQLTVTVDLDGLLGHPGAVGGELGGMGPLDPEGCRRLACDGAVTRVLVTRVLVTRHRSDGPDLSQQQGRGQERPTARLRAAVALLPPALGGAPTQPLEVGRTSRVVQPAQRTAPAVRDGGCAFPDCDRPPAWCEAHHLRHWLHGGPTDLANLILLRRAHHRAVREGGWRLARDPDGRLTATPPHQPPHRRPRTAA